MGEDVFIKVDGICGVFLKEGVIMVGCLDLCKVVFEFVGFVD